MRERFRTFANHVFIGLPPADLQYKNVRPDYLNAIWSIINFGDVSKRLVSNDWIPQEKNVTGDLLAIATI
jgi:hypothetical protein